MKRRDRWESAARADKVRAERAPFNCRAEVRVAPTPICPGCTLPSSSFGTWHAFLRHRVLCEAQNPLHGAEKACIRKGGDSDGS